MEETRGNGRMRLWIFVNHLGEFRYVYSEMPPRKIYVFDKDIDHVDEKLMPHGSCAVVRIEYYKLSDRKIMYYGFQPKQHGISLPTTCREYFEPEIIGCPVPRCLLRDEYLQMTFDDDPVEADVDVL